MDLQSVYAEDFWQKQRQNADGGGAKASRVEPRELRPLHCVCSVRVFLFHTEAALWGESSVSGTLIAEREDVLT